MKISSVHYTRLLLGKVQLGTIHNDQRELLVEELFLCGIIVDKKVKIKAMKKSLIEHKYPDENTDKEEKKYFFPKFLIAPEWSKDVYDKTLKKIEEIRRSRGAQTGT